MMGSTLALALGATFVAAFRVSGSPAGAAGALVFVGTWSVAIGCGLHLAAVVDRAGITAGLRILLKVGTWALVLGATAWAMALVPGPELLAVLLTMPVVVGIVGLAGAHRDRWAALSFLVVALALSALLIPVALGRLGGG